MTPMTHPKCSECPEIPKGAFATLEGCITRISTRYDTVATLAKFVIGLLGVNAVAMLALIVTGSWYASQMSSKVDHADKWISDNSRPIQNLLHDQGYESSRFGGAVSFQIANQPSVKINQP